MRNLTIALLVTFVLGTAVGLHHYENVQNAAVVRQLSDQLQQTKSELVDATVRLSEANQKLAFLDSSKARVQVTAYALTDDFGPDPVFSNSAPARSAYAVPKHTLPAGRVLNVALSPTAERKLHANLNDTIVLMSRNRTRKHLARFVDRTAQTEMRPVVDILFADAHEARIWGRRSFYAVNISRSDSPFQER
jgi:polysaccharide pyruvyl transferase WcaK-like protein